MINKRRDHFIDKIEPILPNELKIIEPDGGFFLCLKVTLINEIMTVFGNGCAKTSAEIRGHSILPYKI